MGANIAKRVIGVILRPEYNAQVFSYLGREALRIVLPSWCVACESELPWDDRTASCCGACWSSMAKLDGPKCRSCALPIQAGELCIACTLEPLPVDWCDAWGAYVGALEKLLYALKFQRHDFLDDALAALLEETLRDREFDFVAGVPMHAAKERKRGYNQAELLARALSRRIGVACDMRLLTRKTTGVAQSTLPKRDRAANVHGAFAASPRAKGKSILIVDDICTTGETLRACASALQAVGASRVCVIAVAKAV